MSSRRQRIGRRLERAGKALVRRVCVLMAVAYFTLAERKVRSAVQRRRGPNVVGIYGLLQPLADGLKLLLKETIRPTAANPGRFYLAPRITFGLSLVAWAVRPMGEGRVLADLPLGRRALFARSALGVYGMLRAGWSSNSTYAFLGALRSTAQRVSYEVSLGFIRISVLLCAGSFQLTEVVHAQRGVWYRFPLFPVFLRFRVTRLAETNRHPFDLPEAESELVSGYNVEYSARGFALFFLGEYSNRMRRSALATVLFRGGWLPPLARVPFTWIPGPVWFAVKTLRFCLFFRRARAAYPRYRYDQLRRLGWRVFLPRSRAWVRLTAAVLRAADGLPG
jgi:NADH-quinone oxidoreductase subunit H